MMNLEHEASDLLRPWSNLVQLLEASAASRVLMNPSFGIRSWHPGLGPCEMWCRVDAVTKAHAIEDILRDLMDHPERDNAEHFLGYAQKILFEFALVMLHNRDQITFHQDVNLRCDEKYPTSLSEVPTIVIGQEESPGTPNEVAHGELEEDPIEEFVDYIPETQIRIPTSPQYRPTSPTRSQFQDQDFAPIVYTPINNIRKSNLSDDISHKRQHR